MITLSGKWVLAGEHTVIRGGEAIVVPADAFSLSIRVRDALPSESDTETLETWGDLSVLVARARDWLKEANLPGAPLPRLDEIKSTIPEGAGLGSSAAVCVAIARAFGTIRVPLRGERERELATHLENYFHGKSSGMDVAAVSFGHPLFFRKGHQPEAIAVPSHFKFELIDSGLRSVTRECVKKVEQRTTPATDALMQSASQLGREGLFEGNASKIIESMRLSTVAYREWGLLTEELEAKRFEIQQKGALSVRLTGSGLGGYFVSFQVSG